jgi:hypothetical protein
VIRRRSGGARAIISALLLHAGVSAALGSGDVAELPAGIAATQGFIVSASAAKADSLEPAPEPPPEASDGDYTLETADTLSDDQLEVSVGAAGGSASRVRRSQRVSFRGGGARGTLRDGDDALAGGGVQASLKGGRLAAGRMAPRWGRGLVLGGAAEPWERAASDRGARAVYRGRSGDGLAFEMPHASLFAGRFRKQALRGVRAEHGPLGVGVLAARRQAQASASWERTTHAFELGLAARGRWRAEAALMGVASGTRLALRVRGGLGAFRPLAEPARAGPARALAASAVREYAWGRAGAFGALWQWRPGRQGARGALEVAAGLGQHASFACGVEQQSGARREPSPRASATGTRQGLWCEWRGDSPVAQLTLRHELWGARAFARDAVRRAVVARADLNAAHGSRVSVSHAVWQVRRGESLYLPEPGADRLVLRASSGAGTRTRAELRLPLAVGDIRLGLTLATGGTRAGTTPPAWTAEWSRRSRLASERVRSP